MLETTSGNYVVCYIIEQEGAQIFRYSNKDRLENKEMHFLFLVKITSAFTILLKASKDLDIIRSQETYFTLKKDAPLFLRRVRRCRGPPTCVLG